MAISGRPLSYCTNVHPAATINDVIDGLNNHSAAAQRCFGEPIAAGLWLPRTACTELLEDRNRLEALAQALWQNDLCCYTLNAFPYGDFHSERVKEQVYLPDWTTDERLQYTIDCANILAELLPEGSEGSISTVPLGGRMNPHGPEFHEHCIRNLIECAKQFAQLREDTGRFIRLAVEPEPFCEIASIPNLAVPFFGQLYDVAAGEDCLSLVKEHVGLCFDVCHQAVEFEDIVDSFRQLEVADIRITKLHITNAIELIDPADNQVGREFLKQFVEPRYLHQTYARTSDGEVLMRDDLLEEDLNNTDGAFNQADAWRVHYHVPIFAEELGPLKTTRTDLKTAIECVAKLSYSPDLEVETYTWPVMPNSDQEVSPLADRIARELTSTRELLDNDS